MNGEGKGNSLQYSCLKNPMDRGAWQGIVPGVHMSRTRLSISTTTAAVPLKGLKSRTQGFLSSTAALLHVGLVFSHSVVSHCVTPGTVTCQAPLSVGFPKQEYWSGLPFPPPEDLADPRIESELPVSPALADRFFTTEPPGKLITY